MKLFLVFADWPHEYTNLLAILTSREEAERVAQRRREDPAKSRYEEVLVEEWTVGDVPHVYA